MDDELKDWIEYQFGRTSDMRSGLRALLERGPRQLEQLRQVQQSPDAFASDYASSLRDAIDDLSDTLDGAAKALAEQEKKFGELKREEKTEARALAYGREMAWPQVGARYADLFRRVAQA